MRDTSHNRRFSPRRTGDASPLGELEKAVMDVVWTRGAAASVGEVQAGLAESRSAAYTTVKTTMERLADKGILLRDRDGKAYLYRAAVTQDELERRIVSRAIDRLVEQFPDAVASFFVRPDPGITEDRLTLLQGAIDRAKEQHDG